MPLFESLRYDYLGFGPDGNLLLALAPE
jgi:hypothetical protein